ncbi:MAG: O-antigen ligase protein [Hyphomicrobiales bacterium]|nr:O-antigen ligase protein [Hyphomicrobiales bacterium]
MRLILFVSCAGLVLLSLMFGGGAARGLLSDMVPQIAAAVALAIFLPGAYRESRASFPVRALLAGAVLLAILPLFPLPPSIWAHLPGRDAAVSVYETAQIPPPWLPVALRPGEAARSVLNLLPPVAAFVAALRLGARERLYLVWIVVAFALASVLLGMLQLLSGGRSWLYAYEFTNFGRSVGLFANANHYVSLLYCAAPLAAVALGGRRDRAAVPASALLAAIAFTLLLGLSISGARTALILGGASLLVSYFALLPKDMRIGGVARGRGALLAGAAMLVVLPVLMGAGLERILGRFDQQGLEDARWDVAQTTWAALQAYFPWGAGWGSFERVYQMHETHNVLMAPIVNHAHNDWLEILLEGGAAAAVLLAAFVIWLAGRARAAARSGSSLDERLARGAVVVLALLAIHSLWDYPLRTSALAVVFALCCAFTQPAPEGQDAFAPGSGRRSGHRRRSGRTRKAPVLPPRADPLLS